MKKKAIDAVLAQPWAITSEALELIASIAEREHEYVGNLEALERKLGRPLGGAERTTIRDGVAVVPVAGPLFRYANLFTAVSGATSYDMLASDFAAALDDPGVDSIVLKIDSPGGDVNGVSQFAAMVREARGKKPVTAYIDGNGASAAYWIASAADRIVAADTAVVGSIGVQMGFTLREPKAGERAYRFVSSVSPNKNASPDTEEGAAAAQRIVDGLAQVFISTVAANRDTTPEKVVESYGGGAVFVAAEALERGMIDAVATFETLFTEVKSMDYSKLTADILAAERPDLVQAIKASVQVPDVEAVRKEAAEAERQRIAAIEELAVPGADALIAKFKAEGTAPETAAVALLKHMKEASAQRGAAALQAAQQAEQEMQPPAAVAPAASQPQGDDVLEDVKAARAAGLIR